MPTNKPEVVLPEFKRADSLAQRCADILLWRKTGSLPDDSALRAFASQQQFDKHEPHRLQGAEYATLQEAAEHIADTLTRPADGEFVMVPREATREIISAMLESRASDEEGEFPALMDLIDFSGQNKNHAVMRAAYRAALSAAPQQVGQEEFANCCDTPAYCSSVRRCTRLDEAKPQQPAEAVAAITTNLQRVIDELREMEHERRQEDQGAGIFPDNSTAEQLATWANQLVLAKYLLSEFGATPPPAIDIGKLRELVEQLKSMAAGERERAKHYSVPTRDAQAMHGLARILDGIVKKLAALIGDGGEKA